MKDMWEEEHKELIKEMTEIKAMIELYKNKKKRGNPLFFLFPRYDFHIL